MDNEIWKPIKQLPEGYEVSSFGNVRIRTSEGQYLPVKLGTYSGLLAFSAMLQTFYVHTQVARAFIPNPENKRMVIHVDGDLKNNHVENLKWVSSSEMTRSIYRKGHGTGKVIRCIETGQLYSTINSAAYYHSILPAAIVRSIESHQVCFGLHFEYVDGLENIDMTNSIYISDRQYIEYSRTLNSAQELKETIDRT